MVLRCRGPAGIYALTTGDRLSPICMDRLPVAIEICWIPEVAAMYPAFMIGSRAVAMMGIRTRHGSH